MGLCGEQSRAHGMVTKHFPPQEMFSPLLPITEGYLVPGLNCKAGISIS